MNFQPGITRATLNYLWRLPDTSEVTGNKCRFVRRNWCLDGWQCDPERKCNRLGEIQDLDAATAAYAKWRA